MATKNNHEEAIVKRVSGKHDDEGHGGAWKVAFADFCLALMCLFLVLWVMAARDKEELQEVVKSASMLGDATGKKIESVGGGPRGSLIDRNPLPPGEQGSSTNGSTDGKSVISKPQLQTPEDLNELAQVIMQMSDDAGMTSNLQTVITPYGLRIMLHDTDKVGMFERGSAYLNERFKKLLRKMGPIFEKIENQVLIVGHTDSLQFANHDESIFSNWSLSTERAMAARIQLIAGGMRGASVLQVVGMADRAPLDKDDPTAGVNRRIELLVLTPGQAAAISKMFGMPDKSEPLVEGVDAALPNDDLLSKLRDQLQVLKAKVAQ
jgi:chemotaxis protein MotB